MRARFLFATCSYGASTQQLHLTTLRSLRSAGGLPLGAPFSKQTSSALALAGLHSFAFLSPAHDKVSMVTAPTTPSRRSLHAGHASFHVAAALHHPGQSRRSRLIGQPTPQTHPHMMQDGEVTPGVSHREYELRRLKLMQDIPLGGTVVCVGHQTRFAYGAVFYPFHQNTDMFYLCGFDEPNSALILERTSGARGYRMAMYVSPTSPDSEMWQGPRSGLSGATEFFGADEAYDFAKFSSHIAEIGQRAAYVYLHIPPASSGLYPEQAQQAVESLQSSSAHLRPISNLVQKQRLIKSPAEVKIMRQAGEISGKAFIQAMRATRPGVNEAEIAARMQYECKVRGARDLAYIPVVAGGKNALCIHYVQNNQILRDGDLVLMDAGALFNGYTSDVTRTWPVSGTFTEPLRRLYQAVLFVQKECVKLCTERSRLSLNGIHDASVRLLRRELQKIGITVNEGDLDNRYYPHHVGHYLGLDLHDTPDITRATPLQEGMVVTIEPALYIPETAEGFPPEYRGVGIRIEDNVLVTKDDPVLLSVTAPKEVVDIEWVMKEARQH